MTKHEPSLESLLDIVKSWINMIERNGRNYPGPTLSDLKSSMQFVLKDFGVPVTSSRKIKCSTDRDPCLYLVCEDYADEGHEVLDFRKALQEVVDNDYEWVCVVDKRRPYDTRPIEVIDRYNCEDFLDDPRHFTRYPATREQLDRDYTAY